MVCSCSADVAPTTADCLATPLATVGKQAIADAITETPGLVASTAVTAVGGYEAQAIDITATDLVCDGEQPLLAARPGAETSWTSTIGEGQQMRIVLVDVADDRTLALVISSDHSTSEYAARCSMPRPLSLTRWSCPTRPERFTTRPRLLETNEGGGQRHDQQASPHRDHRDSAQRNAREHAQVMRTRPLPRRTAAKWRQPSRRSLQRQLRPPTWTPPRSTPRREQPPTCSSTDGSAHPEQSAISAPGPQPHSSTSPTGSSSTKPASPRTRRRSTPIWSPLAPTPSR